MLVSDDGWRLAEHNRTVAKCSSEWSEKLQEILLYLAKFYKHLRTLDQRCRHWLNGWCPAPCDCAAIFFCFWARIVAAESSDDYVPIPLVRCLLVITPEARIACDCVLEVPSSMYLIVSHAPVPRVVLFPSLIRGNFSHFWHTETNPSGTACGSSIQWRHRDLSPVRRAGRCIDYKKRRSL